MSGRQVEKSTTNGTTMATHTLSQKNFKGLYVAPTNQQVKDFSRERIGKFYDLSQNDVVNKYYRDRKVDLNNVTMKQFSALNSVNYFRHCYDTGDNIRGTTANGVWFDEVQDIDVDAIPVVKECQSHALDAGSKTRVTWYTGTPKTFSNTIQQYWGRSTQSEWVIKCPHCGQYQILGIKNLEPHRFLCCKCGKDIQKDVILAGKWIAMADGNYIQGFRISQMMVPWITPEDLWNKYTTYSKGKFYNEVLGRSYEDAAKPFSYSDLMGLCGNEFDLSDTLPSEFTNVPKYMGIDWGTDTKSFTVVTIFARNRDGKLQLIYAKKYCIGDENDPDWQVNHICQLIRTYKVTKVGSDWGFGFVQNNTLKKVFGSRIAVIYYSANQNKEIAYNKQKQMYSVNRTQVLSKYITAVQEREFVWPGKSISEIQYLFDMHLAELAEYRKTSNGRSEELFYYHSPSTPDDGFHSCNYAYLASKLDTTKKTLEFTGVDMPI